MGKISNNIVDTGLTAEDIDGLERDQLTALYDMVLASREDNA